MSRFVLACSKRLCFEPLQTPFPNAELVFMSAILFFRSRELPPVEEFGFARVCTVDHLYRKYNNTPRPEAAGCCGLVQATDHDYVCLPRLVFASSRKNGLGTASPFRSVERNTLRRSTPSRTAGMRCPHLHAQSPFRGFGLVQAEGVEPSTARVSVECSTS